jgi:hypothetical protein
MVPGGSSLLVCSLGRDMAPPPMSCMNTRSPRITLYLLYNDSPGNVSKGLVTSFCSDFMRPLPRPEPTPTPTSHGNLRWIKTPVIDTHGAGLPSSRRNKTGQKENRENQLSGMRNCSVLNGEVAIFFLLSSCIGHHMAVSIVRS